MSSTKMNTSNRRGSMDTKFTSSDRRQLQARNNSRNPMRGFMLSKADTSVKTSLVDGTLKIMNSPKAISKSRVMRKIGSLLTERQSNELLLDSGDRLSQMMMRNDTSAAFDDDSDYDSDVEE